MSGEKAAMKEEPLNEKHPCEDTSLSFQDRMCAIADDKSLSDDQGLSALLGMSEYMWVATQKPPLFTAALSLDSASDKAAAVEAALRAGADPNELDHDIGGKRNRGRALAFFVNADLHFEVNGSLDGLVNNLPAIEVMLRYGADPRLAAPFLFPKSALFYAMSGKVDECAPEFYEAAWQMLDRAAMALEDLYAAGEIERLAYETKNGKASLHNGTNDYSQVVSALATIRVYRIVHVPLILLVGLVCVSLGALITFGLLATDMLQGAAGVRTWREVSRVQLIVDSIMGLRDDPIVEHMREAGHTGTERLDREYKGRYEALPNEGNVLRVDGYVKGC
ncbi:hypothetical protein Daus18300_010014 [Diaporthe australafricana]|uniref:Ankyrin repeat protein n=1 Tax=Diaporthe australafricana TaxID=127596 RepID=A0ABR3WC84_9PEZI